jgi:hypothetical protein
MWRERALKIVLVVVGLLFTAGIIPLTMFFSREPAVPMIMSIYVTLGIFLLLAMRDPAANRSLIAFGGWANLAHAGVMAAQEYLHVIERRELAGVVVSQSSVLCWSHWLPRNNHSKKCRRSSPSCPIGKVRLTPVSVLRQCKAAT